MIKHNYTKFADLPLNLQPIQIQPALQINRKLHVLRQVEHQAIRSENSSTSKLLKKRLHACQFASIQFCHGLQLTFGHCFTL